MFLLYDYNDSRTEHWLLNSDMSLTQYKKNAIQRHHCMTAMITSAIRTYRVQVDRRRRTVTVVGFDQRRAASIDPPVDYYSVSARTTANLLSSRGRDARTAGWATVPHCGPLASRHSAKTMDVVIATVIAGERTTRLSSAIDFHTSEPP